MMVKNIEKVVFDLRGLAASLEEIAERLPSVEELEARAAKATAEEKQAKKQLVEAKAELRDLQGEVARYRVQHTGLLEENGRLDAELRDMRKMVEAAMKGVVAQ
jgi:chromosome segregation ATPase